MLDREGRSKNNSTLRHLLKVFKSTKTHSTHIHAQQQQHTLCCAPLNTKNYIENGHKKRQEYATENNTKRRGGSGPFAYFSFGFH